jgi:hypothetical protein
MKTTIATLCILFVAFAANAQTVYKCIDKDGSSLTTNTPQDGMKCVTQGDDGYDQKGKKSRRSDDYEKNDSVQNQRRGEMIQRDKDGGVILDNRDWQRNRLRLYNERMKEKERQQEEETK